MFSLAYFFFVFFTFYMCDTGGKARDLRRPVQQSAISAATTASSEGGMLCPKGRSDSNDSCGSGGGGGVGGNTVKKRGLEESTRSLPQTRAMSAVPARKKNWRWAVMEEE